MSLLTLDFETYYTDKGLGFKTQTTEEYIRDPAFEVIGIAVQKDDGEPVWFSGTQEQIRKWLKQYDWKNSIVLAHNTMFDGAILSWFFNIKPMGWLDTLSMARALHGVDAGGSLKALAERYEVGVKGEEVVAAINKRRLDFAPEDLDQYGRYCVNDVKLCYELFRRMVVGFPEEEIRLIDMTLSMFTHPMLCVDEEVLNERLDDLNKERSELLSSLMSQLKCDNEEDVRKKLSSNKQFSDVLKSFNIEVPMKMSEKQGKDVPALAKNDEGFIALTEHEDPFIQHLCAVRLGTKSTMETKRIQRFIDIGKRNRGMLPIPLKYYGAHTGRWSGVDKVNFQNLPSRDKKKKALKRAIIPPEGYMVMNSDSSQIEARVLVWLAGQDDVVAQFERGEDVYSIFATAVYEKPVSKENPTERFVGKTCILGLGYGTGAAKLRHTLATSQPVSVQIDEDEAKRIVGVYRERNDKVIELWREADQMLETMMSEDIQTPLPLGRYGCLTYDSTGVILPNGLRIRYPNLRREWEEGKSRIVYDSRRGPVSIWGGAVVENVVQALARIIVGLQMLEIKKHYPVALTVHDAAVVVVPEDEIVSATELVTGIMSKAPAWANDLPIACECKSGRTYGDC
jgi:DNA polymerase